MAKKKAILAAQKQEIAKREGSAAQKKKVVAEHRKGINAKHTAYKKKYPAGTKIKEISTLQALIAKLKRDAF